MLSKLPQRHQITKEWYPSSQGVAKNGRPTCFAAFEAAGLPDHRSRTPSR